MDADGIRGRRPGRSAAGISRACGFTLLEVMVALAVLAVALGALIKAGSENAARVEQLRHKTLAHWVAVNRANELRLQQPAPEPGRQQGRTELAGRQWHWTARIEATPDPRMRRLDIEVGLEPDEKRPLARLTGFVDEL